MDISLEGAHISPCVITDLSGELPIRMLRCPLWVISRQTVTGQKPPFVRCYPNSGQRSIVHCPITIVQ